jgi:hypothetical protein
MAAQPAEPVRPAERERERVYAEAHGRPAQNLEAGYRTRWSVDQVGIPPQVAARSAQARSAKPGRQERTIDLTPLMRLAQESCWSRMLNPPRRRPRPAGL